MIHGKDDIGKDYIGQMILKEKVYYLKLKVLKNSKKTYVVKNIKEN